MTLPGPMMSTITVGGVEKLPVFVADMEEPCLLGLDSLFWNAACDDLRRMQRQVRGEAVPLILEAAAKQVESPVTRLDIEGQRLELHCRVVRQGEAVDATEDTRGGHAAVNKCGGEMNDGVGKVGPMGSGRSEADKQWDGGQHVHPVVGWMEESEQPGREELALESPVTKALEQWKMLRGQESVWQRRVEDAATREHTWLLVNPFSLQVERLEEAHVGISGGHLGHRKTLCSLY